jgi:hypothetical protein
LRAPASAEDEKAPPCLVDVNRLCGLVPPAGPSSRSLKAYWGQLSAGVSQARRHADAGRDRAGDDLPAGLARFCPDAGGWAGGRAACLVDHRSDLSPKCKKGLDAKSAQ